jgi:hypothetical protein
MTGIESITKERKEQIEKHQQSVENDKFFNNQQQLADAAMMLLEEEIHELTPPPYKWNSERWKKMISKPIKERLIIAGALIAAEIDRLQE